MNFIGQRVRLELLLRRVPESRYLSFQLILIFSQLSLFAKQPFELLLIQHGNLSLSFTKFRDSYRKIASRVVDLLRQPRSSFANVSRQALVLRRRVRLESSVLGEQHRQSEKRRRKFQQVTEHRDAIELSQLCLAIQSVYGDASLAALRRKS